jgi:hypothetical protein
MRSVLAVGDSAKKCSDDQVRNAAPTNEDNLDQHVMPMSEGISGDVQLARRFEQFTLNLWAADEISEALVASILRNTPLRDPSVLSPKSLR